jgi:hypothetical protein
MEVQEQEYKLNFDDIICKTYNEIKRIKIIYNRDTKKIKLEFDFDHKKGIKSLNSQQNINSENLLKV